MSMCHHRLKIKSLSFEKELENTLFISYCRTEQVTSSGCQPENDRCLNENLRVSTFAIFSCKWNVRDSRTLWTSPLPTSVPLGLRTIEPELGLVAIGGGWDEPVVTEGETSHFRLMDRPSKTWSTWQSLSFKEENQKDIGWWSRKKRRKRGEKNTS